MSSPKTDPVITVIVPVYNRAGLLTRCLDSIAAQSLRPLALIIVDNNSTDNSLEVARKWADRHSGDLSVSILSEPRPGAAQARQTGLESVQTEWVHFFDSDDVMAPDILPDALKVCDSADIVCWKRQLNGLDGQHSIAPFRPRDVFRCHAYNAMLSTQSYMVRTEFLRKYGGWNPKVHIWNDWELGFRLLSHNPVIQHLDRIGAIVYSQKESITGTSYSTKAGQREAIIDLVGTYFPDRPDVIEMLDYRRVNLAALYTREGHPEIGKKLRDKTLHDTNCNPLRRALLRLIYHYTRLGGRGAYFLWR